MAAIRTRKDHGYSVFQKTDGRWGWAVVLEYDLRTGKPVRKQGTCKTQREASAKALEIASMKATGKHIPTGKDQTLLAFLEDWLAIYVKPHREPKTFTYYQGFIKNHIGPGLGRTPVRKLTPVMIQQFINDVASPKQLETGETKVLSPETVRGIHATLRSALSQAYKNGIIGENPSTRVTLPKAKSKKPVHLSEVDMRKLQSACENQYLGGIICLALQTGMRIGELTGITWDNIDFERETVCVEAQLQRIDGKLQLKSLKTDRSQRILPLSATAVKILQQEKANQVLSLSPGQNELNLAFLNADGRPLDPKYVNSQLKSILRSAGLPVVSMHKLRHTVATVALGKGIPLTVVRDFMGHSQIALTANTYSHAVPKALRDVADMLDL